MPHVTAEIVLKLGTDRLQARVSVPQEPMSTADLLPIARALMERIINSAVASAAEQGRTVTCRAGCGACCRQLVPITGTEARQLAEVVEAMPEPRRTQVRERFARAKEQLETAGFWDQLREREKWDPDEVNRLGVDYFALGIACPFLEDESCSIHPDRPLTCREYLVTSPPENCARPRREDVAPVTLPVKVWPALARFDPPPPNGRFLPWVPLIMILDESVTASKAPPDRPGPQMLDDFFRFLTGKEIPGTPSAVPLT